MYYYVKVTAIADKVTIGSYITYKYESPIGTISGYKNIMPRELKDEILKWAEDRFNELGFKFEEIVIEDFNHSHIGITWMEDRGEKISEDMLKIYELSKKECAEYEKTIEGQKEYLLNLKIPSTIRDIKHCRELAEELKMLDTQEYLSFLDTINELSID